MLGWIKRKAAEKQESNIRRTLQKLIELSNEADSTIRRLGDSFPQQKDGIHKLQSSLLLDLIGPMSLDEVKRKIIDPELNLPNVTDGARLAVNHVLATARET